MAVTYYVNMCMVYGEGHVFLTGSNKGDNETHICLISCRVAFRMTKFHQVDSPIHFTTADIGTITS